MYTISLAFSLLSALVARGACQQLEQPLPAAGWQRHSPCHASAPALLTPPPEVLPLPRSWLGLAQVYVSYGGLLMQLTGDPKRLEDLDVDQSIYLLLRKVV